MLALLKAAEVDTLVVLVDEFEYLFSQKKGTSGVAEAFNTLRELHDLPNLPAFKNVDSCNVVYFFAVSADGWKNISRIEKRELSQGGPMNAFHRRVRLYLTLDGLSAGNIKMLIERRLITQRSGKTEALIPFSDDFVDFLVKSSLGNPSKVVTFCHEILQRGLDEGVIKLTKAYARKVLQDSGLLNSEDQAA